MKDIKEKLKQVLEKRGYYNADLIQELEDVFYGESERFYSKTYVNPALFEQKKVQKEQICKGLAEKIIQDLPFDSLVKFVGFELKDLRPIASLSNYIDLPNMPHIQECIEFTAFVDIPK